MIAIPAGTYTLWATIDKDLTLVGAGAENTVIQAAETLDEAGINVFNILEGVNVTISGVTIRHGKSRGDGGAITNSGTLTLENSVITGNEALAGC